jgi:hypothetical protein
MGAMSDYLEGLLQSHVFGSGTYTKPSTLGIALCANVPIDSDVTLSGKELANTGSYARQALNPSATNWKDPVGTDGQVNNLVSVTFTAASADWGWVSGVAICDSTSYNGGHVLYYGALTLPKLISSGDQFKFNIADINLSLD